MVKCPCFFLTISTQRLPHPIDTLDKPCWRSVPFLDAYHFDENIIKFVLLSLNDWFLFVSFFPYTVKTVLFEWTSMGITFSSRLPKKRNILTQSNAELHCLKCAKPTTALIRATFFAFFFLWGLGWWWGWHGSFCKEILEAGADVHYIWFIDNSRSVSVKALVDWVSRKLLATWFIDSTMYFILVLDCFFQLSHYITNIADLNWTIGKSYKWFLLSTYLKLFS